MINFGDKFREFLRAGRPSEKSILTIVGEKLNSQKKEEQGLNPQKKGIQTVEGVASKVKKALLCSLNKRFVKKDDSVEEREKKVDGGEACKEAVKAVLLAVNVAMDDQIAGFQEKAAEIKAVEGLIEKADSEKKGFIDEIAKANAKWGNLKNEDKQADIKAGEQKKKLDQNLCEVEEKLATAKEKQADLMQKRSILQSATKQLNEKGLIDLVSFDEENLGQENLMSFFEEVNRSLDEKRNALLEDLDDQLNAIEKSLGLAEEKRGRYEKELNEINECISGLEVRLSEKNVELSDLKDRLGNETQGVQAELIEVDEENEKGDAIFDLLFQMAQKSGGLDVGKAIDAIEKL